MRGPVVAAVVMLVAASPLLAEDDYRYGRIRYAEPGVTLQRASESVSEEAEANLPFLPGDRVWTSSGGRAEFQFGDGSLVRLDGRSKLEYMPSEDGAPTVLRLHSGSLILHAWAAEPGFEIETPGGLAATRERGVYRVDVEADDVRLSVYEGEATLASGRRRVRVAEGEQSYARRGDEPDDPRQLDRRELDEFARWDQDREGRASWASERRQYIPDEVAPYAGELESHGSWYYQVEVGYVWRPYVASGWQPYCHGRWVWTAYGWTWVPQESWGWAPSHYGRWDYAANLGWYWIPGSSWGPAWVHWAVGSNYVGWCPRGYHDRVVPYNDRGYRRDGSHGNGSGAWVYANRDQINLGFAARRPVATTAALQDVRVIDAPHSRPTRDFHSVEAAGRPTFRAVRTKPTIGDTVPELRSDNSTTIPAPVVRRRPSPRYDRDNTPITSGTTRRPELKPRSGDTSFSGVAPELRSQPRRSTREWPEQTVSSSTGAKPRELKPRSGDTSFSGVDPEVRSQPRRSTREWPERTGPSSTGARPRSEVRPPEAQPRVRNAEPASRTDRPDRSVADPDREVLRRMFRPITETPRARPSDSSGSRGSSGSSGARERTYESHARPAESRPTSGRTEARPTSGSRTESRPAPRAQERGGADKHPPKERH